MPDCAVFAGPVYRLENQQERVTIGRVEELRLRAEARHMARQELLVLFLRLIDGIDFRRPFF